MSVQFDSTGTKVDERLEFVKDQTRKAIVIFTDAIKASSEEQTQISFKAFTLSKISKEESVKVFEIVMTIVAIYLNEIVPELIKTVTFYHSFVSDELDESHTLLLHCDKSRIPPTKEEIEEALKKEEEANANEFKVSLVEKETTVDTVVEEVVITEAVIAEEVVAQESE